MSKSRIIKIKYFDNEIDKISKIDKGDWIDLRAAETVKLSPGDYALIPLGVGMILPEGYEAHVVPRSSTFKNYGILQTNSMGIIDNSYCGEDDQWHFPAYATRATTIHKNDRICQFRIQKKQPEIEFEEVEHLKQESRGGFGSTGVSTYDDDNDDDCDEDNDNEDDDDDDFDEPEIPNNEYEAAEGIFFGFSSIYLLLPSLISSIVDHDGIVDEIRWWDRNIDQGLDFLNDGLEELDEEERVKRIHQIMAMIQCLMNIVQIRIKFNELRSADVSREIERKLEKIFEGISSVFDEVIKDRSRIGGADEFRRKYTEAVRYLTDVFGEDNVLATQEHIDNMVATYEFFIDARSSAQLEGGAI